MYKAFFGLNENPFNINTDPRYLYRTRQTQDALASLAQGIESRKGFLLLTGEVGTGKTTLLNKLLESLQEQGVATAFVFDPRLNAPQLFDYMIADFGIQCGSHQRSRVLFKLHQWLLNRYAAGQPTVLVVDEAQNLSKNALEEIRLLTNLETSSEKLLQIVIAGQPELEDRLEHRDLRQLRQRIAFRVKTLPLTAEETNEYVLERLRIAGGNGQEIFTPEAVAAIHGHARGIPRVTNLICEHALLRAFALQQKPVSLDVVEDVTRTFRLHEDDPAEQPAPPRTPNGRTRTRRRPSRSRAVTGAPAAKQPGHPMPFAVNQMNMPLFVYGYDPEGSPFYEQVQTIATSERGGLVSMQTPVALGQKLLITNRDTEYSEECVVEFIGARLARGVDVGLGFSEAKPQFWRATDAVAAESACA